jgi:hypothetical protein
MFSMTWRRSRGRFDLRSDGGQGYPIPDDDMVLETAINGSASAIVTFNQRDFAAGIKGFSCAVILPAMALQQIRSVIP